jgi:hypothetical protein
MLMKDKNSTILHEHPEHISSRDVRDAYRYLVGAAATDDRFTYFAAHKGAIRDFRFFDPGGQQAYAFIVNRESPLFYFRAPAVACGRHLFSGLQPPFTEVGENESGEWTVRIADLPSAQRLWTLISPTNF